MPNSQPNSLSGSSSATSDAADCAKSCDNPDPLQFKEGDLIAFRSCDGYEFNVIELTKLFHAQEVTLRTRIKGNILTIFSMTEKYVIFRRESSWENGSMLFAHVLRTPDDEIVEISADKFVTEEGVFFSLACHVYKEICCIAAAFEKSIS